MERTVQIGMYGAQRAEIFSSWVLCFLHSYRRPCVRQPWTVPRDCYTPTKVTNWLFSCYTCNVQSYVISQITLSVNFCLSSAKLYHSHTLVPS